MGTAEEAFGAVEAALLAEPGTSSGTERRGEWVALAREALGFVRPG